MTTGLMSLIPVAGKEAAGAKVSVSLLLIAGLCYGTYYLGAQSGAKQTEQLEKVAKIEVTLERVTTLLEVVTKSQDTIARDVRAIEDRTNKMNTEMVELSSKVPKGKK